MNLRELVELMQATFVEFGFLSQENAEKVFVRLSGKKVELSVPASRAVEPLPRCKTCTLMYDRDLTIMRHEKLL